MPDVLTRLQEADPAAHVHTDPPDDVLRSILATPLPRKRRAPRLVLAAGALAVAALVALAALPSSDKAPAPFRASLAERAFAATIPKADFITYTETTTVQTGSPKLESYDRLRQWQYQDRMHNIMDTTQPRGTFCNVLDFRTEDVAGAEDRASPDERAETVKEQKLARAHVEDSRKRRRHGAEAGNEFCQQQ